MARVLDQSKRVFRFFEDICEIPRGSGDERQISDWVVAFAKARGLWVHQDEALNVIIKKKAAKGYESAPAVMLQGHMDMVCEKNSDTDHDFSTDPLVLYIEGNWLRARGTTLGADDGCGIATMLAILDDEEAQHPALECVFTVEEEIGLLGAAKLDYSLLSARRLVGLDSAGETNTAASTAGGLRLKAKRELRVQTLPDGFVALSFEVKGLKGGHSGIFIDKERGNSIKIATRILNRLRLSKVDFQLIDIAGGSKDNAIPRECLVSIALSEDSFANAKACIASVGDEIKDELKDSDEGVVVAITEAEQPQVMYSKADTDGIVDLLYLFPNGVSAMSMAMEDLVLTSSNVGVVWIKNETFNLMVSLRSAIESRIDELCDRMVLLCKRLGFAWTSDSKYPGMEYQQQSPFRERYASYMKAVWGRELKLRAGHAGGECGYFVRKLPGLELVSLGPFIEGVHSPDERLNIASFARVYDFLVGFLASLTE